MPSSNRDHGSYGHGDNYNNGGQKQQKPKVNNKSGRTDDKVADKESDPRYWPGSNYYGPKDTGRSNDARYHLNSGRR